MSTAAFSSFLNFSSDFSVVSALFRSIESFRSCSIISKACLLFISSFSRSPFSFRILSFRFTSMSMIPPDLNS